MPRCTVIAHCQDRGAPRLRHRDELRNAGFRTAAPGFLPGADSLERLQFCSREVFLSSLLAGHGQPVVRFGLIRRKTHGSFIVPHGAIVVSPAGAKSRQLEVRVGEIRIELDRSLQQRLDRVRIHVGSIRAAVEESEGVQVMRFGVIRRQFHKTPQTAANPLTLGAGDGKRLHQK